jgi:hypothetical protein
MPVSFTQRGKWDITTAYLRKMKSTDIFGTLDHYGEMGVNALMSATPVDSGLTAQSWSYEITRRKGYYSIRWYNSHVIAGVPIAIILQYGHGTGTGGYVHGRDYIMPAVRPIFDLIDAEVGRVVRG